MKIKIRKSGYSIIEVLVAVAIGVLVIEAAYLFFPLGSRIAREGEVLNELSQTARIVLSRIERDIRQTPNLITNLPASQSEATNSIFLIDGYPEDDDTDPHYIAYEYENNNILRKKIHYTDPSNPTIIVNYDFPDATEVVETNEAIGEDIDFIKIWEEQNLVKIDIKLKRLEDSIRFLSSVYPRND